jgi:hypothetical protein
MVDGAIAAHVVVDDAGMSGHGHLTVLGLSWSPSDPLAVVLTLSAQPDHPALPRGEWAVLRDFLRYGVEEATGDGDVRIQPSANGRVLLELQGESKAYAVHLPAQVLCDFLDQTESVVPAGSEADEAVMDALIARLLEY